MSKSVLIVGAGIGGLTTALRLAKKGYKVTVIEKNSQPGGRLNQIKKDGFTFDTGPSFFSMTYEFDEFARDCNIKLPFKFIELDPLYTVNFIKSGKTYTLNKDIAKLAYQFRDIEPDFEVKMRKYLNKGKLLFEDTVEQVNKRNYNSLFEFFITLASINPKHLPILFYTFWQHVCRYFSSDDAKQIVSLVAFFLGRTPYDTPAIYTLLSYSEFVHNGYYNVEGGMYRIVEGLVDELEKENVTITCNTEIAGYKENAKGLECLIDKQGISWSADSYVINSDAALFRGKVFGRKKFSDEKLNKMEWTMGALTIYLGIKGKLDNVEHHNYFLGSNFENYAKKVFVNPGTIEKPYYYVNVLSKSNPECAPEGCESLFFVCPVPDLRYKSNWDDRDQMVESIIADFGNRINKDISKDIISKTVFTPYDWQNQFNLYKGSGLGLSHKILQIGAFRPKNYDEKYKNVFYVGASTIPGTGLPMAVISSKLASERVENYCGKIY
jgi:phytoene desaturase